MDWVDRLLIEKAAIHMKYFEIGKFKKDFPSLYHTIRAMMWDSLQYKC